VDQQVKKTVIGIGGMHCAGCALGIEERLKRMPGIKEARVNFASGQAFVAFDPAVLGDEDILRAVTDAGYTPRALAAPGSPGGHAQDRDHRALGRRAAVSLGLAAPLMYIAMADVFGFPLYPFLRAYSAVFQLVLTTLIIICGFIFFGSGLGAAIRARRANMDTLIVLGAGSAYLYSIFLTADVWRSGGAHDHPHLYYETAGLIVAFILLGKYLESSAKTKTSAALSKLMALAPETALVLRGGEERSIPIGDLAPGDIVIVKPGVRVPADGIVTEGYSSVDEALVTGEPIPVEKIPGKRVIAGTVNKTGAFRFKAVQVGAETFLSQVISLVREAQGTRPPIQRLADTAAGFFVPAVIVLAVGAFGVWFISGHGAAFALSVFISVLIIACPCALGLATPAAVIVATGIAAARGILIKQASSIQRCAHIDTVVFDKTGTLTKGEPRVSDIIAYARSDNEIVCLAASVEKNSEHPLAEAVVQEAAARGCVVRPVAGFIAYPGKGVGATVNGEDITLGNRAAMDLKHIELASGVLADARRLQEEGKTVMFVAAGAGIAGMLAVGDTLRESAAEAVVLLRRMGKRMILITGDHRRTAEFFAQAVGIDAVLADVLPQDKQRHIQKIQEQGAVVAMIGDGINDAPALAQADVGIAIGSGTDIAREAADIVLIRSDPRDAVVAVDLSRYAMKKIKQNLFWAFFYNLIAIPVAAGALYPVNGFLLNPMIAAAAMALSSVSVVANALSMRRYRPPHRIKKTFSEK